MAKGFIKVQGQFLADRLFPGLDVDITGIAHDPLTGVAIIYLEGEKVPQGECEGRCRKESGDYSCKIYPKGAKA